MTSTVDVGIFDDDDDDDDGGKACKCGATLTINGKWERPVF